MNGTHALVHQNLYLPSLTTYGRQYFRFISVGLTNSPLKMHAVHMDTAYKNHTYNLLD